MLPRLWRDAWPRQRSVMLRNPKEKHVRREHPRHRHRRDGPGRDARDRHRHNGRDVHTDDPDAGAKKALVAEREARKAVEKELAGIKKAQEKAAEEARLAKLSDDEKRDEIAKAAAERAEAAEKALAVERAARKHGLTDDKDLELLEGLPADKVDAIAKRIAAQKAPAGRSGNPVDGGTPKRTPTNLTDAVQAALQP
ncbi:hypothetical protein GS432_06510 [Rhodococcus hoagii]|nr:hypothetical protein [Prescottella equi]